MAFPQSILTQCTELYIDGEWTDITSLVYSRDQTSISRGRANEAGRVEPGMLELTANNRSGDLSPRNPVGAYYGLIGRNTPIRHSVLGDGFLQLDAATGNTPVGGAYVSTPDAAAFDMGGGVDVDLRIDADLTSWRETMELVSKWTDSGNQRSYALSIQANGTLAFWFSQDGSTIQAKASDVPVPITNGRIAVRGVLDSDNGGGGYTISFWTAPTMDGTWTQLGDYRFDFGGTVTVFSGSGIVALLDNPNSTLTGSVIRGKVYSAQIYSGATLVGDADFSGVANQATSFVDSTGKTWTLNGAVEATTRDSRFCGEVPSWPQKWDLTGADRHVKLQAAGIFQRLGQGQSPLSSVLKSGILSLTNLVAYWPMEDNSGSTRLAPGRNTDIKMVPLAGTFPDYEAETAFKASKPIPNLSLTALSGTIRPYTSTGDIQLRFLLHIPSGGATNGATIARLYCGGTAPRWDLVYGTGGTLALQPYDSSDTAIGAGSGTVGFNRNGELGRISVELDQSGANVNWRMTSLDVGDTTGGSSSGTLNSRTVTSATKVVINPDKLLDDVSVGHVSVQSGIDSIYALADELNAYTGETAGRRIQRLCREQGITIQGNGDLDDTVAMGPQLPQELLELIQECADADLGLLFEPRDQLAIGYMPRSALYAQAAAVSLSYPGHQMSSLEPVEDDQLLRNKVTVRRVDGSSAIAEMTTGPLSTNSPSATPPGIGVYDDEVAVNVEADSQVDDQAGWRLRLGTINEARFPLLPLTLANSAIANDATVLRQIKACDVGSRVVVTDPPVPLPPEDISEVIQGVKETMSQYQWDVAWNLSPSSPFDSVGIYWGTNVQKFVARYSSDGTVTTEALDTTETGVDVDTPEGPAWTHADGDFDIGIGGEQMTVTGISGAGPTQVFTVIRSVNGVVKSHLSGAEVTLWTPAYYAL